MGLAPLPSQAQAELNFILLQTACQDVEEGEEEEEQVRASGAHGLTKQCGSLLSQRGKQAWAWKEARLLGLGQS